MTNSMAIIMIGRHAPKQGAGKIYAFRGFVTGLFVIGFNYLSGWMIDQSFNKVTFLLVGGVALLQVVMFAGIRLCCKNITDIPAEDEDMVLLFNSDI